jgi:AcrR family transcriptional regulator
MAEGAIKATSGAPRKRKLAHDKVLAVAADLFYRKGIRAVGVEEIVRKAGVAKISLYRSFRSKDELIVAYLEGRNADFWRQWDEAFLKYDDDPPAQLRAIMTYLARRTAAPGYRGCPFINFSIEFPVKSHPGHRVVDANKREWRRRLVAIAQALGAPEPKRTADRLMLLVEGAYAVSQTFGGPNGPTKEIISAAETLAGVRARSRTRAH